MSEPENTLVGKDYGYADEKPRGKGRKEQLVQKHSMGDVLAEAVLVDDRPYFLISNKGEISLKQELESGDKILRPLEPAMYMGRPYSFSSEEEIQKLVEETKHESLDTLMSQMVAIWKKYVDADDLHISLCAADTVYTYFQDKIGSTHYLFFVGNNSSGKSNNPRVLHELSYRNMMTTSVTTANIYRFLGSGEEGQGTLCEDEADGIDFSPDKMSIYKNGYTTGIRVMRTDSSDYGSKQFSFNTFCFKAFAAERLPDSVRAKGFNQRVIEMPCYCGCPEYDISEVVNPAGVQEYEELKKELRKMRTKLLIYRLLHFHMPIPPFNTNLRGRENQLFGPIIRIFQNTSVSKSLFPTIAEYVRRKRGQTVNSFHAHLHKAAKNLMLQKGTTTLASGDLFDEVIRELNGQIPQNKPMSFDSAEFGSFSQKTVIEAYIQLFGAKQAQNRRDGRKLIFDEAKFKRAGTIFELPTDITISDAKTGVTDVTDVKDPRIEPRITQYDDSPMNACKSQAPDSLDVSHPSQPSQTASS